MRFRRNILLQRRAIAIFTLLAMLVAPLCGSLCGARVCAGLAPTQSDDCHSSVTASGGAPGTGVATIRVCGLQEFPSAAFSERTNSPDRMKQDSALPTPSNFVAAESIQLLMSGACWFRADNEPPIANTSVGPAILRI